LPFVAFLRIYLKTPLVGGKIYFLYFRILTGSFCNCSQKFVLFLNRNGADVFKSIASWISAIPGPSDEEDLTD
jgi:hypothetical protein